MSRADARAQQMAEFCVALGMTPTQYRELTLREKRALTIAYNRHHRK